jgi:PEGA domain
MTRTRVKALTLSLAVWFGIACATGAQNQNTNQVLGQVDFEGKTNIDKSSGVWVDGQYLGYVKELKGNKKVLLVPGKHEIAIRQVGYKDIRQTIEVGPGSTTIFTVRMERDPNSVNSNATGEVKLKVTPDRAAVFVDGNYAGYVHQFGGVKRAMLIAPGKHHIKIALPGYRDFETDITVQANQKVTVKTALIPASITAEGSELK